MRAYIDKKSSMKSKQYLVVASIVVALSWLFYRKSKLLKQSTTQHTSHAEDVDFTTTATYFHIDNFLNESYHKELMNVFESLDGGLEISKPTAAGLDPSHIGEAIDPIRFDAELNKYVCDPSRPFLQYNLLNKKCMLFPRVDSGIHFIKTGTHQHLREPIDKIARRPRYFNKIFDIDDKDDPKNKVLREVFANPGWIEKSKEICGSDYQYIRPYQSILSLQLPGNIIPTHTDAPFYMATTDSVGRRQEQFSSFVATPYNFPIWLLVVMKHSQLFQQYHIPEVNTISYIHPRSQRQKDHHENDDDAVGKTHHVGGELVLFPKQSVQFDGSTRYYGDVSIPSTGGSAVIVDGTSSPHTTNVFLPDHNNNDTIIDLVHGIDTNNVSNLPLIIKYMPTNQKWKLYKNSNKPTKFEYDWNHVRASLASRAWCFKTEEEAMTFDPNPNPNPPRISNDDEENEARDDDNPISMNNVLDALRNDLIATKGFKQARIDEMMTNDKYELGMTLIKTYVHYPKKLESDSTTSVPLNYCLIFKKLPETALTKTLMCSICNC